MPTFAVCLQAKYDEPLKVNLGVARGLEQLVKWEGGLISGLPKASTPADEMGEHRKASIMVNVFCLACKYSALSWMAWAVSKG